MQPTGMQYFPLAWPFLAALALLLIFVVALIELRVLRYAYERIGVPSRYVFLILLLSLLGSSVNIPIAQLPSERMVTDGYVDSYGVRYIVPVVQNWPGTIVAINVGGALVPTILSMYLLIRNDLYLRAAIATAVVAAVVHQLATPTRGVGITVPIFIPPAVTVVTAMILSWRKAAPLAYISGSLGTLIGADLLNLGRVAGLGAPVASIGGAGTFDGVFLTGIIAVLLAPIGVPRRR